MAIAGTRIKQQPRPRVLGWLKDDELSSELAGMFPTYKPVSPFEVEQTEWDLLISDRPVFQSIWYRRGAVRQHMFVITFGRSVPKGRPVGPSLDSSLADTPLDVGVRWSPHASQGEELVIPDGLPGDIEQLVRTDLVSATEDAKSRHVLLFDTDNQVVRILLRSGRGETLAAEYERLDSESLAALVEGEGSLTSDARARALALPGSLSNKAEWVRVAVGHWRSLDPAMFRDLPGWERRTEWMTSAERRLASDLKMVEKDLQRVVEDFNSRRNNIRVQLDQARVEAGTGLRQLLTSRGTDLEPIVADALQRLGFEVELMDPQHIAGDKLEDLRVRDASASTWIALVEVKAYSRGARVGDLLTISRFSSRYSTEHQQQPAALWYVVSQFVGRDPASRPRPLASNPKELAEFQKVGGLTIDSGWLFRAVVAVESGQVDAREIRDALRAKVGALGPEDELT